MNPSEMGRYIFFQPTDIEHKFFFGIQPSEDILKYGGYICLRNSSENMSHIRWTTDEDLEYVHEQLMRFKIPMLDVNTYEKTTSGYYTYMSDIRKTASQTLKIEDPYSLPAESEKQRYETYALYVLGHSIYFQLHMVSELNASYE